MTAARPRFVLLPGLDGTGHFSQALRAVLERESRVDVLAYPPDRLLGYRELAALIAPALPRERHVIVAESFAGPLALMLARMRPVGLAGLVLGATFASLRLPCAPGLAGVVRHLPARLLPAGAAAILLWGSSANRDKARELQHVLQRVAPRVLAGRAAEAVSAGGPQQPPIDLPALVIRAQRDAVVGARATGSMESALADAEYTSLDAPHFLFQERANESAALILEFARRRVYSGS